ncbi:hypothetical protein [Leptothoe spongobia]|uniref:Uncharacterized protein n=1 Tax=Leptothoe spongobia TAU-MAC 1115 TaxID=1967444 RepID=A0A947GGB3_9CYAN|nr:hypothetical protein [Leptothoe spongobia]MBT9314830.1 hypothetical protein [Leptothoe spongobia TAU-MAC 1115]
MNLKPLRGKYRPNAVRQADVLNDELILDRYLRCLELPFKIYDLCCAHAGRMAIKGTAPAIAARSQGHSLGSTIL